MFEVNVVWGKTWVKYSRTEPTRVVHIFALFFFYLLILIQDLLDAIKVLEERIAAQDAKIISLESNSRDQEDMMLR